MAELRFCAYQYQHLPLDTLRGRWRDAELSGFDVLWNCDTVVDPDQPRSTMFDGPAMLTMMAADTSRIRVGTLVTSLYFRQPVPFAKAAVTVDHLSGGRVELALGVGDPSAGAKASGADWPAGERVARFRTWPPRKTSTPSPPTAATASTTCAWPPAGIPPSSSTGRRPGGRLRRRRRFSRRSLPP
jgi:hypothetical protein